MPDPETDISNASADFRHDDTDAPEGEAVETSFAPDAVEASRARELGLGVGERELGLQRDAESAGAASSDDEVEVLSPEEIEVADNDAEAQEAEEIEKQADEISETAQAYSGLGK